MRMSAFVVVAVLLIVASGCASRPWWASGEGYTFAFQNSSDEAVRGMKVEWERGALAAPEVLPAGAFAPGFFGTTHMPDEATVTWTDAAGTEHEEAVDVAGSVPERFGGVVVFGMEPEARVAVVPLSEREAARLAPDRGR